MRVAVLLLFINVYAVAQSVVRGPYLQLTTPTSILIRWQTNIPTSSKASVGITTKNLSHAKQDSTPKTNHSIEIHNLLPNTKYFYSISTNERVLQGDSTNFFVTPPSKNTSQKIRFLALGDCGVPTANQQRMKAQFMKFAETKPINFTVLLGDNAYTYGYDNEYQTNFFNPYQSFLKSTVLFPALGNHDYYSLLYENEKYKGAYFDIFTNPTKAEMGGVASETEAYYSYDYGNIHFVVLDSYGTEERQTKRLYDTLSPQMQWLKKDLAANQQPWTIAYWHHPPYGKADYDTDVVDELTKIRENVLKYLERAGVDLVLCGHAHVYERSYLIRRHYGKAATFRKKLHGVSLSSGKYDGTENSCPYIKQTQSGTVYVVAGSSAQIRDRRAADFPHPAMVYSNFDKAGSLIVEIENNRLDAQWLCEDGIIRDNFTIMKDVNKVEKISIQKGENITLTASWIGSYVWNDGSKNRKKELISPLVATTFVVEDDKKCLADTFKISVPKIGKIDEEKLSVFPNPTSDFVNIEIDIPTDDFYEIKLSNLQGNSIFSTEKTFLKAGIQQKNIQLAQLPLINETVLVSVSSDKFRISKKVKIIR